MHTLARTPRTRPTSWMLAAAGIVAGGLGLVAGARADDPPANPSVVVPLAPVRILDTRAGIGVSAGRIAADQTIRVQVTGAAGIPAEATGVLLNVTVTAADGAGYVTAFPAGGARPNASVINFSAGEDVANMITATLGEAGGIELFNAQSSAHLVADVAGYLLPTGAAGGLPGPAGPIGPQGPAGPAAPTGIRFTQSMARSDPPLRIAVGSIAAMNVFTECGPGFERDAGVVFLQAQSGSSQVTGSKVAQKPFARAGTLPNAATDTFFAGAGGAAGSGVSVGARLAADGTTNRTHIVGTLTTPTGAMLQIDLYVEVATSSCSFRGLLTPAA